MNLCSMRSKKSTSIKPFFFLLGLSILFSFLNACSTSCASFDCVNGECEKGSCVCDEGWEGNSCNTPWSAKFAGLYQGTDCYDSGTTQYTIASTGRPDSVVFDNRFYGLIEDGDQLVFPSQDGEQDGAKYTFSGTGSIQNGKLHLLLFSDYESFEVKCELSLSLVN